MIVLWGIVLSIPELAIGGLLLHAPSKTRSLLVAFSKSIVCASILTVIAWFGTARELDMMGIEVFDKYLKIFPGQLWLLAIVLSYLCIIWMPKNLTTRAITGILMLFPASLFRVTRFYLPYEGFAAVHFLVVFAYAAILIGMYGMFYPWKIEKAFDFLITKMPRTTGAVLVAVAIALIIAGVAAERTITPDYPIPLEEEEAQAAKGVWKNVEYIAE